MGTSTFVECMGGVGDCLLAVYSLLDVFSRRKLLALQKVALSILAMAAAQVRLELGVQSLLQLE